MSTMSAPAPQANGDSTTRSVIQVLPSFSDPSILWSAGPTSASFLLQEAQGNLAQLRVLKEHVQAGQLGKPSSPCPALSF